MKDGVCPMCKSTEVYTNDDSTFRASGQIVKLEIPSGSWSSFHMSAPIVDLRPCMQTRRMIWQTCAKQGLAEGQQVVCGVSQIAVANSSASNGERSCRRPQGNIRDHLGGEPFSLQISA